MAGTLVIRFGALGDFCVTAWFLAGLADADVPRPLTVVTKRALAPLAAAVAGVDRVLPLSEGGLGGLARLAARIRAERPELWLDAHGVLRSRALGLLCARRADARLRKDTLDRLRLIREGGVHAEGPALLDRLDALVPGAPGRARLTPRPRPPLASLRPVDDGALRVALAPGARWPTKRWPDAHAVALLRDQLARDDRRVLLLLGPEDAHWLVRTGAADLADHPRLDILPGRPLVEVAAALGRCRAAVTNDSGLLHLSEAVGTPVTALFGPTVRAFGYAPLLPASRLLESDLECRPCSRTGSRPCHRGDLACLATLAPEQVSEALEQVLAAAGGA
ncbi:MAG TPA: glycosyltransferase family 9 protein [Candidatus Krumholzibacteria bacterium]|nr:glycosyltransferase family 9 protein [Candidatus Krumholzibacteria bacterium]